MDNYANACDFALALDKEDYDKVSTYLDLNCNYILESDVLFGQKDIVDSYKKAGEWARENLDSITYKSEVEKVNEDTFLLTFTDNILHKEKRFTYRSKQVITFNKNGKIVNIKNEVIPEMRVDLQDFFKSAQLIKP